MGDLVKSGGNGLVGLLHGKGGELSIPKPFEKDIFLFDTYVAGTTHIEGIEELEPHLNNDDRLEFFREPDNRYDNQRRQNRSENRQHCAGNPRNTVSHKN